MADQFVQSSTGMFVSARPLVRLARSDSFLAWKGLVGTTLGLESWISGPPSTMRWPWPVLGMSRANKQTRTGVSSGQMTSLF